jgi:hypothetical protein
MSNIYYCQPSKHGWGMLRAVLSLEEGKRLLKLHTSRYVGQEFPVSTLDSAADFAVLRIFDEEPNDGWRVGFHRFDAELGRIEETVRACTTKLSNLAERQVKSKDSRRKKVKKK